MPNGTVPAAASGLPSTSRPDAAAMAQAVRRLRQVAEQRIEELIALLDELDGDPDIECDQAEHDDDDDNGIADHDALALFNEEHEMLQQLAMFRRTGNAAL